MELGSFGGFGGMELGDFGEFLGMEFWEFLGLELGNFLEFFGIFGNLIEGFLEQNWENFGIFGKFQPFLGLEMEDFWGWIWGVWGYLWEFLGLELEILGIFGNGIGEF